MRFTSGIPRGPASWKPELPQHRPLDRHGGVPLDEAHHLPGHLVGEHPAARHRVRIDVKVGDLAAVGKSHGSFLRRRGGAGNPASQAHARFSGA